MTQEEREQKKAALAKERIRALEEGLRKVEHLDWLVEDKETSKVDYRQSAHAALHNELVEAERSTRVKQGDLDKEFPDDGSWGTFE